MAHLMALAFILFFIETASPEEANIYNFANFYASGKSEKKKQPSTLLSLTKKQLCIFW